MLSGWLILGIWWAVSDPIEDQRVNQHYQRCGARTHKINGIQHNPPSGNDRRF
jgi:hypothetical protein